MRKEYSSPVVQFWPKLRDTRFLELAYILLLPVVVWRLSEFSPFSNGVGTIDPWVYFGYIHNFQDLIDRYGLPYYSVRFGLIFPHMLLAELLGPIKGYLAFCYLVYLLAGVPLYLVFRKLFSVHAAVLAYAILVSSVWFARTVFWTYSDAAAVPYLIAAACLMLVAPKYRRTANFVIGVLIALAVNSNVFALSIGGLMCVAYFVYYRSVLWETLRQDLPWMGVGFILTMAAGMVGYYACCGVVNYLEPTLVMMKWSASGSGHVYQSTVPELMTYMNLYLPPFLFLLLALVTQQADHRDRSVCISALVCLGAVIVFFVWYRISTKTAILEYFYYFSFLLVPSIICIALIPVVLARKSNSPRWSLNLAIGSFLLPPVLLASGMVDMDYVPTLALFAGIALTVILSLATARVKAVIPYVIVSFGMTFHLFWYFPSYRGLSDYARILNESTTTGRTMYRLGASFIDTMPAFKEEKRPIFFWYDNSDRVAHSLQSTYLWGYSRLFGASNEYKGLPSLKGANLTLLAKHEKSSLVLFDRDKRNVDEGVEELRRAGISFSVIKEQEICEQDICYSVSVLNVDWDPSKEARGL